MEPSYPSGRGRQPSQPSPPKKELPLQGPRPSPLRVAKQSHSVQKPPRPHQLPHPSASTMFMAFSPSPTASVDLFNLFSSSGDVSPAARVAAIEWTSPTGREKGFAAAATAAEMGRPSAVAGDNELMCMLGDVQLAQSQGILTPTAPPAISVGFFSPATEPHMLQDLSPFWPPEQQLQQPVGVDPVHGLLSLANRIRRSLQLVL